MHQLVIHASTNTQFVYIQLLRQLNQILRKKKLISRLHLDSTYIINQRPEENFSSLFPDYNISPFGLVIHINHSPCSIHINTLLSFFCSSLFTHHKKRVSFSQWSCQELVQSDLRQLLRTTIQSTLWTQGRNTAPFNNLNSIILSSQIKIFSKLNLLVSYCIVRKTPCITPWWIKHSQLDIVEVNIHLNVNLMYKTFFFKFPFKGFRFLSLLHLQNYEWKV